MTEKSAQGQVFITSEPLPRERLDPASRHAENQLVLDLIGRESQPN